MTHTFGTPATSSSSEDRRPILKTRLIDNGEMMISLAEDQKGLLIAKRCLQHYKDEEVSPECIAYAHVLTVITGISKGSGPI